MNDFTTPMMVQYNKIKKQYSDCLVLFRLGDFYEMFMDDAKIGSRILEITLTSRDRGKDGRIPMAGIPYHALDSYLFKLVKAGYKVAICEQVSEPGLTNLVEREVVRIVTPGTVLDENSLIKKENNYIIGLHFEKDFIGLAVSDLSTGFFQCSQFPKDEFKSVVSNEISKFNPTECVLSWHTYNDKEILRSLRNGQELNIFPYMEWEYYANKAKDFLENHFGVEELTSFGIEEGPISQKAAAGLLGYLKYTQKNKVGQIKKITPLDKNGIVALDKATLVNLEIFTTLREGNKRGSLVHFLDNTLTASGGRLLREWLIKPLTNKKSIEKRYSAISEILKSSLIEKKLREHLSNILDLERIISRLSAGIGNPKDLIAVKNTLKSCSEIKKISSKLKSEFFKSAVSGIQIQALNLADYIGEVIDDNPPFDPKVGGLIRKGVNKELDKLRHTVNGSKDYISKLEIRERKRSGITSLKVKFNQVFGYYIEITRSNLDSVPEDYMRKQTLVNAERFITPELKKYEEIILMSQEKINKMEYDIFLNVVQRITDKIQFLQTTIHAIAEIDCVLSFAKISGENNYCRPILNEDSVIEIKNGRHPVVENELDKGSFVPNDTHLNQSEHQLLIITGPNMAGKSVYIRQVAVIVLLSQIGCFVPAEMANISIVDKIFVRSGASDVISKGLSTFMVEMLETANILNNATDKSLIIMDEIGRGTSTYDGISIAWSVAEYLVSNGTVSPKTLFATHYHELQGLEDKYPDKIRNYQILVKEDNGIPVFIHKVDRGGAEHSFGIAVAKLAGIPQPVCDRAYEILKGLKLRTADLKPSDQNTNIVKIENEEILERLKEIDISGITPLEALNLLAEIKKDLF